MKQMKLEEFKNKAQEAIKASLELQHNYFNKKEELTKKFNEGYFGQNGVDEELAKNKKNNQEILNNIIRPLLEVSKEVEQTELEKINANQKEVTTEVFNELNLVKMMKPSKELYQKYLDKYSEVPLAVEFIQGLAEENNYKGNNLIILDLPKNKGEQLHLFINRVESYLMSANIPNYNNYSSLMDFQLNGNIQAIEEDFNKYQEL